MTIRWGVIGCGRVATIRTIPEGILAAPNAKLVATADINPDRAHRTADSFGGRAYDSAQELLADDRVDAVYIAAPPYAHAELTIAAAQAGKHVLCEKPMAMDPEQAAMMARAVEQAGIVFGIGFMMRYHTCHAKLKELVDSGAIGKLVALRARYSVWSAEVVPGELGDWQHTLRFAGGGPLFDMGCHAIDLFNYFAGEAECVAGLADTLIHSYETEDTCAVLMKLKSGPHAIVQAYNSVPNFEGRNVLEVHGSEGTIVTRGTLSQLPTGRLIFYRTSPQGGKVEAEGQVIEVAPENMYRIEIERFAAAVEAGRPYEIGAAEGIYAQRVMAAAYESARTGAVINL
ncbi:MAG: Gfo/Idh/MocA family oxidoreductase [Ardenticatenaceae bacterium]|nr:Gfo/Idh/MocA family oxidoreductase [Ardenticatenaceae bacterium]HBY93367.1 hypothetical protein [Chloroflexota bacterium]